MFVQKFHCELNPIEMLWGFMKYCASSLPFSSLISYILDKGYHQVLDGKFPTDWRVIPECFDMFNTIAIHYFFCKSLCYMDAYWFIYWSFLMCQFNLTQAKMIC